MVRVCVGGPKGSYGFAALARGFDPDHALTYQAQQQSLNEQVLRKSPLLLSGVSSSRCSKPQDLHVQAGKFLVGQAVAHAVSEAFATSKTCFPESDLQMQT